MSIHVGMLPIPSVAATTGDGASWALCPVLTQNPPEGTIVDLDSTVTFTITSDDGSGC